MQTSAAVQGEKYLSTFLVERYWPGVSTDIFEAAVSRGERSAREMRRKGRQIRYLGSTLVSADETVFCLFEAEAPLDVAELNEQAGIPFDRIVAAVALVPAARAQPTERK